MFETLVESHHLRGPTGRPALMAAILHAGGGIGLVLATTGPDDPASRSRFDPDMIWVHPTLPPPTPADPPPAPAIASPPGGFPTITAPVELPQGLPPIELTDRFHLADFTGGRAEGADAPGGPGTPGPIVSSARFLSEQVDEPVVALSQPSPRYPPALQQAGLTGLVDAEYVVDTTGHAEPESWKVVQSTFPLFEGPAREAALNSIFRPARIRGRAVRQLVRQRFRFTMDR